MREKAHILIVDDTPGNIDLLLELLGNYRLSIALNGSDAIEMAQKTPFDLLLLDVMMPNLDGFEVCKLLKKNTNTKKIPVIFITAKTDEESIELAYASGGVDYVTKPFKPKELLARVKTHLHLNQLIKSLEYASSHDMLTDIYNRRKFFELATERFLTQNDTLYVIMIDIDHFKKINDTYGHHVGDKVIKSFALHIQGMLENEDIFGRIGGEEFALISQADSDEAIFSKVDSLRKSSSELIINGDNGDIIQFTVSCGVKHFGGREKNIDELMKAADEILYKAKEDGRNRTFIRSDRNKPS